MRRALKTFMAEALKTLSGKINDFYLAGGTALSSYYFHHRESFDLDFFTHEFSKKRILEVVKLLSSKLKKEVKLVAEQTDKNKTNMIVFYIYINKEDFLKIDFVQDLFELIKSPQLTNGIKIMSLEDIYIRKIYAVTGALPETDDIGRQIMTGGRQEAKDFYDLYCLSNIFINLNDFSFRYCSQTTREAVIRWFRTYSRMDIKTGLLQLKLKKTVDYKDIERHFKKEIEKILEHEIGII